VLFSLRGEEHVQAQCLGGSRNQGVEGEGFREAETQQRIGRRCGATRCGANGLAGRIKASKWIERAERNGFVAESRGTRKRALGRVKREPIAVGGSRRLRANVGVAETSGDKTQRLRSRTSVTNYKGAEWPREGCATFREGKSL